MNDTNITTDKTIFTLYIKNTFYLERFIYRYFPHTVQYKVQSCQSANWNDISFGQLWPTKDKTNYFEAGKTTCRCVCNHQGMFTVITVTSKRHGFRSSKLALLSPYDKHLLVNGHGYGLKITTPGEFNIYRPQGKVIFSQASLCSRGWVGGSVSLVPGPFLGGGRVSKRGGMVPGGTVYTREGRYTRG